MSDVPSRVTECFHTVFPTLAEHDATTASVDTVDAWDSLKTVTLVAIIEEEFEIDIPLEELEHMVSYAQVLAVVQAQLPPAV